MARELQVKLQLSWLMSCYFLHVISLVWWAEFGILEGKQAQRIGCISHTYNTLWICPGAFVFKISLNIVMVVCQWIELSNNLISAHSASKWQETIKRIALALMDWRTSSMNCISFDELALILHESVFQFTISIAGLFSACNRAPPCKC